MRARPFVLISVLAFLVTAGAATAKELWVPVAGNAQGGNFFRTDLRIVNPSFSKDIVLSAWYLPVNQDNTAATPVTVNVPKRGMLSYSNVVDSLFHTGGFGAIRMTSSDDFIVTSRTFADNPCSSGGIFGQFIGAQEPNEALLKGVVAQLSVSGDNSTGFRSNVGFTNPSTTPATVTLVLYGNANEIVKSANMTVQPYGAVIQSIQNIFGLPSFAADNVWVSFTSDHPVIGYGSVADNRSADQIFIPASEDSGSPPAPPPPQALTVNVGPGLTFNPSSITVREGDTVNWQFLGTHTSTSDSHTGAEVWDSGIKSSGSFSHTFNNAGDYLYYCTLHSVPGGSAMNGVVHVTPVINPGDGYKTTK